MLVLALGEKLVLSLCIRVKEGGFLYTSDGCAVSPGTSVNGEQFALGSSLRILNGLGVCSL